MPKKRPLKVATQGDNPSEAPDSKRVKTSMRKKSKGSSKRQSTSEATTPGTANLALRPRPGDETEFLDLNLYYQSGTSGNTVLPIQHNLNKLFDQYRDQPREFPDRIGIDGAQRYLNDLGVQLDEVAHLALCDLLQCPSIGEFEREAFLTGWRSASSEYSTSPTHSYDTVARQSPYINTMRKKILSDPIYFKQIYRNAFKLAKPEGQKSVPMDSAIEFWKMFFSQEHGGMEWNSVTTPWLDLWVEFYSTHVKRPVNKDLWNMVGELMTKTKEAGGESLEWWTEDGAWPMAVDDFVGRVKERRKAQGDSMDVN